MQTVDGRKAAGLYIHVPVCHAKCWYCDFYSMPKSDNKTFKRLVESLVAQWKTRRRPVRTLYLGGGTPSAIGEQNLVDLIRGLDIYSGDIIEGTVEVNPEDVTPLLISSLMTETPIRRISMGVQSLNDAELRDVGRRHTAAQALEAYEIIRRWGVENVSLDLIYGLPGQTLESWRKSLRTILERQPEHLSAYALTIETGTRLSALKRAGKLVLPDEDTFAGMYDTLCEEAYKRGYIHYEIANFALPGFRSRHNSAYWDGLTPYVGIGPGAHSWEEGVRSYIPSDLKTYLAVGGHVEPIVEEETRENRINDLIMTMLRCADGLDLRIVEERFGSDERRRILERAKIDLCRRMLRREGEILSISEEEWLRSDDVIMRLFE